MTTTRRFCADDLFRFTPTNLDALTETVGPQCSWGQPLLYATQGPAWLSGHYATPSSAHTHRLQYHMGFYLAYLSRWPDMCTAQENPSGRIMAYCAYGPP
jgi:hypothetical protein